ncbi:MAG TPA: protein kinase [Thermoanaerobaculia bacterium]|nr:protein kinase [Thermoanaerobaculia bacterium]
MTLAAGARLGPYEVLDLLGRGGMGEVYGAIDSRLGRQVAVKILPAELTDHEESLARFRREARAIAALSHPNIVSVFDIGTQASTPYVVTELLDGETLRTRLQRGAIPLAEALKIASGIADGLAAAHAKGIIHRDLKPENVFLTTSGVVKILDFGLAATQEPFVGSSGVTHSEALTEPGLVIGTIGYMSPEQLRGQALTTSADVFAFGCVLYEMVRGEMPFQRESNIEIIAAVLRDEPFRRDNAAEVATEVRQLIDHCLAKEPRERLQNGAEVAAALRPVIAAHETGHLTTERLPRIRASRMPRIAFIAAALLLVAIVGGAWWLIAQRRTIDNGYDLHASDITGSFETRRLVEVALRVDAAGNRSEAIELCREAARSDPRAPLPVAFLASFTYYNGDTKEGLRWADEVRRRLPNASSTYETLLSRYLLPDNDNATLMALASSLLELRPKAWRLRLSLAHRHMDRREIPAMLAQLQQIDVSAPDDRRLAIALSDRASCGDIAGAERDLQRSRLMQRPALLAFTRGRIAWSRGNAAEAARLFDEAAESATVTNLVSVAMDSRVLAGMARIGAGQLDQALQTLDLAALKSRQTALPSSELEAQAFAGYVAYLHGDHEGTVRRLTRAIELSPAGTSYHEELRLLALRMRVPVKPQAAATLDSDVGVGVPALVAARESWARNDLGGAARLLQQARAEGVESTWFAEEAALLAYDLGAPPRAFKPDPPYPNRLRLIAGWELARAARRPPSNTH